NLLVEQDAKEDPEKESSAEYQRIEKCFSIIKTVILEEDFSRLFPVLSRLLKCRIIFWNVIDDIEKFKDKVPKECVDELITNLLVEITNLEDLEEKARILQISDYVSSKHKIENSELFDPLKDILNSLFTAVEKEKESFDYGKDFLSSGPAKSFSIQSSIMFEIFVFCSLFSVSSKIFIEGTWPALKAEFILSRYSSAIP
ncbi:unnamed protein product, partial [marine sediment metagenome]